MGVVKGLDGTPKILFHGQSTYSICLNYMKPQLKLHWGHGKLGEK